MAFHVELDTAFGEKTTGVAGEVTLNDAIAYMLRLTTGATARVVTHFGPAGGWPVVEYTADTIEALRPILHEYFDDAEDFDWVLSLVTQD